ncbi:hypothetical protein KW849_09715 [Pseudomonas sp. PDM26]|uniref:hypothetical protein n=1 Tax=unclassified Pseudomonas TaxID=196821 RepID=UPI001C4816A3|nr:MULTISPECIES: hypothetical protein [unclassified Pseudomonas]MBV7546566.1 hypothetical protein [Pseudomonas sp. PDM26]
MQLGNVKHFKGIGYVCFLDILGFSQDILSNWNAAESNPLDKLLAIKSALPVLHDDEIEAGLNQSVRSYVCRVNTVSDSITIAFGLENKLIIGDMVLGLEALLANVREVWRTAIELGYTLRGAIDFGDIYWDRNELVGPAFINAYRLESEIARVSRVVVSSKLNKLLSDLASRYSSSITEHLIANFRKDVDGYIVLDPYKMCAADEERRLLVLKLQAMASQASLPLIKEKYAPLIEMLSKEPSALIETSQLGCY